MNTPQSILECFDDVGNIDHERVLQYHKYLRDKGKRKLREMQDAAVHSPSSPKPKAKRAPRGVMQYYDADSDEVLTLHWSTSAWYICYVSQPAIGGTNFSKKFRNKFRLPFDLFGELVEKVQHNEDSFPTRFRANGGPNRKHHPEVTPIALLVLGALRVLGRGTIFDSLTETTYVGAETHREFVRSFIDWGSKFLYTQFVYYPRTQQHTQVNLNEMKLGGMPVCVGSTDATHIALEQCSTRLRNAHAGKEKKPTRTYNTTVDHHRRFLNVTPGHPGRWNDKTLVLFDQYVQKIRNGEILSDVKFFFVRERN
mmetsp:Transcript_15157/g.21613  ORF Transcript_15157/g.21613 Transcript_15157/m.21613 type:complete len:311 (+) Transcript_15157:55-987(+)